MSNSSIKQNKIELNRREFIKTVSVGTLGLGTLGLGGLGLGAGSLLLSKNAMALDSKPPLGHVVIIGGGYAGATAAKYIRMWSLNSIAVTVIEKSSQFVSCPLSNLVLGGSKNINELTFGYDLVQKNHGIKWVQDEVVAIDCVNKKVQMAHGEIRYDRLIIAPGIDFMYDNVPQLQSTEAQERVPHAWKAGWQTVNLRKQLESMPDGGVFVMNVPKAPYRCPPGPYERVCQVASYFKQHKPKSKIIVLDANAEIISKRGLFTKAWAEIYPSMIDYRPNNAITNVDAASKTITTDFETVTADVLNVIPPQRAGKPAQMVGLNNIDKR